MGKIKINLKSFFEREAKILIKAYKNLMSRRQGVRLDSAPHNKASTIKRKGKDHWLVDSGNLRDKGFESKTTKISLEVYASRKPHKNRNDVSYEELFKLHNQKGYSGIFGELPVGSGLEKRLIKELDAQIIPQLKALLPKTIHIK